MSERTEDDVCADIEVLIAEIAALRHPDEPPFVKSWAIVSLVQNGEMLQRDVEHSEYIHPREQSIATTVGLHSIAMRDVLEGSDA
jgi:hypothetical protein